MGVINLKFPSQPRRQAKSNTERQRLFRQRHPGYYARLKATRRASINRGVELAEQKRLERISAEHLKAVDAQAVEKPVQMPPAPVLMLPAPAELSVFEVNASVSDTSVQQTQPVAME